MVILKKVKIFDHQSPYHLQVKDIYIAKGKIEKIADRIDHIEGAKTIESGQLSCSPGWVDIGTQVGEPGLEHRETLQSIVEAARVGGYTGIAPFPNTIPVLQTKAAVKTLLDFAASSKMNIYPIASATIDCRGIDLSEMYDLHKGGAVAYSDGLKPIQHNGVLRNALNYVKAFNGLIIHFPQDEHLASGGHMHEGETSTYLGMKGIPAMAEHITLRRDMALVEYTESRMCIYGISSKESVKIIKDYKHLKLTSTVPYLNLIKDDQALKDFDSNLKVSPPLRNKKDMNELIKGLKEDTITAIVSNHYPLDEENKKLEFTYAKFGASGIETVFPALNTYLKGKLDIQTIVRKLSYGSREILNLAQPIIKEGEQADMTLFDAEAAWEYSQTKSLSKNNPFLVQEFTGKVIGTIVNGKVFVNG